jgi:hypothetical protein
MKLQIIMDTEAAAQHSKRSMRDPFDSLPDALLACILSEVALEECGCNRIHAVATDFCQYLTSANTRLSAPTFDKWHCKCSQNSIAAPHIAILTLAAQHRHGNQASRAKQMNFLKKVVLENTSLGWLGGTQPTHCLSRGELGHSLSALRHCVLGELPRQDQPDCSLDFARGDGRLLVVPGQLGCLSGQLLKDVVNEGVQDADGLAADASVGVDLLEHLVDVDLEGLHSLLGLLLALGALLGWLLLSLGSRLLLSLGGLLSCRRLLSGGLGSHGCEED